MRNLLMATLVVGLLAAPSLGVITVKIAADGPVSGGKVNLLPNQSTTVRIMVKADSGVYSVGGDVKPTGTAGVLTSSNMVISSLFKPTGLFTPKPGTLLANGGWQNFGSQQTTWDTPDGTIGNPDYVEFAHYTVAAGTTVGDVTLTFFSKTVSGYKPMEVDKTSVQNTPIAVTIHVPEPMTLALLALGGLVVARRRR